MTEQQIFELMKDASPIFMIVAFLVLLLFRLPGILGNWGELQEKIADKERQRVQGLESVMDRAMDAVRMSVDAMERAQSQSRTFYIEKLEAMRSGLSLVEDQVRDLKNQLEDKEARIKEQEARIRELERENADKDKIIEDMQGEMAELKRKLALKEARKAKREATNTAVIAPAAGD